MCTAEPLYSEHLRDKVKCLIVRWASFLHNTGYQATSVTPVPINEMQLFWRTSLPAPHYGVRSNHHCGTVPRAVNDVRALQWAAIICQEEG